MLTAKKGCCKDLRAGSCNFAIGMSLVHTINTTLGAVIYWNDSDLFVINPFFLVMNYNYCKCRTLSSTGDHATTMPPMVPKLREGDLLMWEIIWDTSGHWRLKRTSWNTAPNKQWISQ